MGRWRAYRRLPPAERRILLRSLLLFPAVALSVRVLGLGRTRLWLERAVPGPAERSPDPDRAAEIARLVDLAGDRGPWPANCLQRSLVLCGLLQTHGMRGELRIGVRKGSSGVEAHAWVELGGVVLNDREDIDQDFTPFDALPHRRMRWR